MTNFHVEIKRDSTNDVTLYDNFLNKCFVIQGPLFYGSRTFSYNVFGKWPSKEKAYSKAITAFWKIDAEVIEGAKHIKELRKEAMQFLERNIV